MRSSRVAFARRTALTAVSLLTLNSLAGAQVNITFYETFPASAPDPALPYPGGAVICTAVAAGSSTGFSLNFGDAAQRALFCPGNPDRISASNSFGARITGSLVVAAAGNYSTTINADDGDVFTVNGITYRTDWFAKGGGPGAIGNIALNAGANPLVFDYFQGPCCGAFVELVTGANVTVTPPVTTATPEPASVALIATGLVGLAGGVVRRRRLDA